MSASVMRSCSIQLCMPWSDSRKPITYLTDRSDRKRNGSEKAAGRTDADEDVCVVHEKERKLRTEKIASKKERKLPSQESTDTNQQKGKTGEIDR